MCMPIQHNGKVTCAESHMRIPVHTQNGTLHYKRRRWSPEEDSRLVDIIEQYGARNWTRISLMHGTRDGKQCRERWIYHIGPNVDKSPLSDEEMDLLIKMQAKYGNRWSDISAMMPGRTAASIKNYWNATMAKSQKWKRQLERGILNSSASETGNDDTSTTSAAESYGDPFSSPKRHKKALNFDMSSSPGNHIKFRYSNPEELVSSDTDGFLCRNNSSVTSFYREEDSTQSKYLSEFCISDTFKESDKKLCLLGDYDELFLFHLSERTGIKFVSLSFRDIEAAMHLAECSAQIKEEETVTGKDRNMRTSVH